MRSMFVSLLFLFSASEAFGNGPCVVPDRGHFYIHTGTSGLFGAFAHEHLIQAEKIEGCAVIDEQNLAHSSIKLTFAASGVRVKDPKEDADNRAKVQATMETDVLKVSEYPQIVFESNKIESGSGVGMLRISGNLTIRGKTQPIVVPITFLRIGDGTYRASGKYKFRQTTFGIKPVTLAGGTVKVKDELETEFELFLK
jgi:polyisoprenoid-binding protein YceI